MRSNVWIVACVSCVYRGKGIRITAGGLAALGLAGAVMAGVQSLLLVRESEPVYV